VNALDVIISELTLTNVHSVLPLLEASRFKPLRFFERELGQNLSDYWFSSITDTLGSTQSKGYLALKDGQAVGFLIISDNPWETKLFGKNAAVINLFVIDQLMPNKLEIASRLLAGALENAKTNGVNFVSSKTYANDLTAIHALELNGFLLMDTVVDCHFDFRRTVLESLQPASVPKNVSLRLATQADRQQLVEVAGQAFRHHFGRYHADEKIGNTLATQAYEQWMHSSLDGYADWIHVAEVDDHLAGFSIWKRPSALESQLHLRVGHYSIAGIDPRYNGLGLFTALTYAGMQSLEGVADIIEGPTHVNNYGVQLGYAKLGWRVVSDARQTFHKWL